MKKVLAVALTAAMVLPTFAYAADPITKDNFNQELKDNLEAGADASAASDIVKMLAGMDEAIVVDSNMQIRLSSGGSYGDDKITEKVSSSKYPSFDFINTLDMSNVRDNVKKYYSLAENLKALVKPDFYTELMSSAITGDFDIEITYPKNLDIDSAYINDDKAAYGFVGVSGGKVNSIFEETKRERTTSGSNYVLKITMSVIDGVTCQSLIDNLDKYLADMQFEVVDATPKATGEYKVSGDLSGSVNIGALKSQDYKAEQDQTQTGGHSGLNESFKIVRKSTSSSGGSSGRGSSSVIIRPNDVVTTPDDQKNFDTENHIAYINGYPDGSVRPNGNITREEATAALYRLISESKKSEITADVNIYTDVDSSRWSNVSISSMSKGGYVGGYDNATFMPDKAITRAEFATIAVRFFNSSDIISDNNVVYNDVADHWAASSIYAASARGIMKGYEDGSFHPNDYITRAEAMAVINRMTSRAADANSLIAGAKTWSDVSESDWYYYDVMEATNGHTYDLREDGYETWKELK